ncbi:glycosyltransferase [Belnapia rosea]|uniref:glycosyltransferase n=1 Tax=Belnapia rosea TaxID=938405 RepID=UPI00087F2171|nr:cellulose synthase catalytic subunit [Belnapia rosea]SDB74747.1 cellulose synthase (UDP-forming) [Belnapia rosea]
MLALGPYAAALAPALLVIGLALAILPLCRKDNSLVRAVLFGAVTLLLWRYIAWRYAETVPPFGLNADALASWAFLALEALTAVSSTLAFLILSRTRDRKEEANRHAAWWAPAPPPTVDILIATYNEEESILERTIAGALAVRHSRTRVWILDDGRREWLRELCERTGARHLTRSDNAHAKAGNINAAFKVLRALPDPPDFIAVLDADFVPHADFLDRALALFHDPRVGLVQTPQHFFNADPIQNNLGISRAYPDEQRFFFDHIQPARDAWGIAFCCGTSSVMRWAALEAIGGFPVGSVTEDYLITLRLQEEGYSTVYLNEAVTEGLAPEGLGEYITQRGRWCLGLMQIIRGPMGPFSKSRLRLIDRVGLLDSFLYWASTYPFRLACLLTPLLYWFLGITVVRASVPEAGSHFLPYYAAVLIALNWTSGGQVVPVLNDVSQILGAKEISKAVILGLWQPKGHKFKVTAKGGDRSKVVVQWPLIQPLLWLFLATVAGMALPILWGTAGRGAAGDGTLVILFWSFYNLAVLAVAMLVCVELPGGSARLRRINERVEVRAGSVAFDAWLSDLMVDAARLRGGPFPPVGSPISVEITGVGPMGATVAWIAPGGCGVALQPSPAQRQQLYARLHTQSGVPGTGETSLLRLAAGAVRRAVRS